MNTQLKISIVIPCYNGERHIRTCLASLKRQTYPNFEALIVNDGSTDDSLRILKEETRNDDRFKIISQPNAGSVAARRKGIKAIGGDYFTFIDIDDELHPHALEVWLQTAWEQKADIVVSDFLIVTNRTQKVKRYKNFGTTDGPQFTRYLLTGRAGWQMWGKLFRSELLQRIPIDYPNGISIGDDAVFVLQITPFCRTVVKCPYPLYRYVQTATSLMHTNHTGEKLWRFRAVHYLTERYKALELYETYKTELSSFQLLFFWTVCRMHKFRSPHAVRSRVKRHLHPTVLAQLTFPRRILVCCAYMLCLLRNK